MLRFMSRLIAEIIKHLLRRGKGIFKILFTVDDFIRLAAMTLAFSIIAKVLNLGNLATMALVLLGVAIDLHDFLYDHKIGKIEFEE